MTMRVGASLEGTSPLTPVIAPELLDPVLSVGKLKRQVTVDDTAQEYDTCIDLA